MRYKLVCGGMRWSHYPSPETFWGCMDTRGQPHLRTVNPSTPRRPIVLTRETPVVPRVCQDAQIQPVSHWTIRTRNSR